MSRAKTPSDARIQLTPRVRNPTGNRTTGNHRILGLGTERVTSSHPTSQTATPTRNVKPADSNVDGTRTSRGKTTFFTRFGLLTISVGARFTDSANRLKTSMPQNIVIAKSPAGSDSLCPQRALSTTENTNV